MLQARNQSGAHAPVWQGEERAEKEGPNMWHEDVSLALKFHRITGSSNRFLPTLNTSTSSTSNVSPIDARYYEESSVLGGSILEGGHSSSKGFLQIRRIFVASSQISQP